MRCKTCDYPLWQIRDRRCPECGTGFRPGDFDFVLNAVRFCCPHCDQAYYGTGDRGHLSPRTFACVSCGRSVDMDDMVLLPTEGVREEQTKVEMNPWLERDKRGFFRAWLSTTLKSLGTPNRLMEATPDSASTLQSAWFALITNGVYVCTGLLLPFAALMVFILFGAGGGGFGGMAGGLTVFYLGIVAAVLIGAFIWAAAAHLVLVLTGPVAAGIGRTTQCMLYSSAAMVVIAVPCLGFYFSFISGIWWAVAATMMVLAAQRVETWRAIVAVLAPLVLLVGAAVAIIAGMIWYSASQASAAAQFAAQAQAQAAATQAQAATAQTLAIAPNAFQNDAEASRIHQWGAALLAHHAAHDEWPTHPAELIKSGGVWPGQFVANRRDPNAPPWAPSDPRPTANVLIGSMSIDDFQLADVTTQETAVRSAMTGIPGNTIACRVGDTVFVYYGIDPADMPGELWLVIGHDEPAESTPRAARLLWVVRADGHLGRFAPQNLGTHLAEQNALRVANGLSPIPDLATIRADRSVVGEEQHP
ncbi:MAG: YIP1 family protein [Phycisphaeraceae bacterium]|nr:YIP1 family protein [Phycisphaeraceae bacterium]MBX3405677.1 YIP1 family protein [Phycisphaeraceae bacterium]